MTQQPLFTLMRMRRCAKCRQVKPLAEFSRSTKKVNSWCRECFAAYTKERRALDPEYENRRQREWNKLNPEKRARYRRRSLLKNTYGLTEAEFDGLLAKQNGRCPICLEAIQLSGTGGMAKLAIDHDHETGRVRGLLCGTCNTGIGLLKDDVEVLARALDYVEFHSRPALHAISGKEM